MAENRHHRAVGSSIPRVDGAAKVRGTAVYVDDLAVPGALYGATVRSSVAHGVLKAIHRDPAFDWSDVVVVTAEDVPGENFILTPAKKIVRDQPALVAIGGTIRHQDEPVALVAAPTRERAMAAREHLRLEVEELPAILTMEDALLARQLLHGDDNVFASYHIGKGEDVEAALASCDLVIEGEYRTPAQEQMYIEPQGVIADWDGERYRVHGSLQCPYYAHMALKALLGVGDDEVVIHQTVTGGGFGGKEEYPSMIAGHAALLSRAARRPVRLIYERDEDIGATTKRHPARVRHRLGLRNDGTFVAADIDVLFDGGAYITLSPVVLSRGVLHASGPYRFDHVRIVGRCVATNHPPHGAFRGFGAPQTTFAYERQVDKAARALGIDPFELRKKNMLRSGDETATSQTLGDSVGSEQVLAAVEEAAGKSTATGDDDRKRGRGLAFYFHGAGFTGSGEERLAGRAAIAFCRDRQFEVRTSSTDIGQGALTIFTQIAATALDVDVARVRVAEVATDQVPDSGPTVASRTCMIVGGVVERAAARLRERIEAWAAERELTGAVDELAAAMLEAEGEFEELAQYAPPAGIRWDDDTYTGSAYPVFGWAACLVDVAVDPHTYEVEIERCIHAIDVGKAIHPIIVKGQIEGGTLQALGWATIEDVLYREGRVANRTMTNCIVPTAADAPEMETIIIEEPYASGPHGAKGVGEIPMDGPASAVASAVTRATGADFDTLPVSPERIATALAQAGGRRGS